MHTVDIDGDASSGGGRDAVGSRANINTHVETADSDERQRFTFVRRNCKRWIQFINNERLPIFSFFPLLICRSIERRLVKYEKNERDRWKGQL